MRSMEETVLAKELKFVSTRALYSGKRGRMSAAQTWGTGRLYEAVDKYCKQQWDRCRNLRKQGWNRNFDGCAERWNEDEVLRHSMHEEREKNRTSMEQAPMPTEKSGKGKGKKGAKGS